jgi:hypothetical protein
MIATFLEAGPTFCAVIPNTAFIVSRGNEIVVDRRGKRQLVDRRQGRCYEQGFVHDDDVSGNLVVNVR